MIQLMLGLSFYRERGAGQNMCGCSLEDQMGGFSEPVLGVGVSLSWVTAGNVEEEGPFLVYI